MKSVVAIAIFALAGAVAYGVNALKLDTTSLVTNSVNWSGGSGTGGTVANTQIGEFGATPSATSLAGLTLQGTNITLGGLQFDSNMNGPATILSGGSLSFSAAGANCLVMQSGSPNVTINCTFSLSGANTFTVPSGSVLTMTGPSLASGASPTLTGGGTITNGNLTCVGSADDSAIITGAGTTLTTGDITITRNGSTTTIPTATTPVAAGQNAGFYVGSTVNAVSATTLHLGNQNSGSQGRIDGGNVSFSGAIVLGASSSGGATSTSRGCYFEVNGGTFTSTDTTTGVDVCGYNNGHEQLSEFYLASGTANVAKFAFGTLSDVNAGIGWIIVDGASANLYVGGSGISLSNSVSGFSANIGLTAGLLGATANWSSSLPMQLAGPAATPFTIQAADAAGVGHNITLNGGLFGVGSLTKTGSGMLTLGGTNTYAGATSLKAGELVGVTGGSISNTASVLVGAGATLGVQLASVGGLWTTTNLIATNASTLDLNLNGFAPSTTVAPLQVLGNLATTNALNFIVRGSVLALNTAYPLIKYTGIQSGTLPANPLLLPARVRGYVSNDSTTKAIYVVVTNATSSEPLLWTAGTGTWDTTDTNWVDVFANPATYYDPNFDQVVFDDTATGTGPFTVTLTNTLSPLSVTVNNTNENYTISGTGGVIAGSGSLTKIGTGTLTLSTANTFSGGLIISNGTVSLGNIAGAGSGTVTLNSGATFSAAGTSPGNAIAVVAGATNTTINNNNVSPGFGGLITSGDGNAVLTIDKTSLTANADQLDNFAGTVNIGADSVRYSSTGGGSNGGTNATFNLIGSLYTRNPLTQKMGALTGTGTLQGAGGSAPGSSTIYIGYKNINSTFGGVISEGSGSSFTSINKLGTGILALTNTSTYAGNTIVSGGTLEVDGQITASPVTNYAGTTLAGTGSISYLVGLGSGSTIAPGVAGTGNYGTLTCNGGLIFNGATNLMDISTTNSDLLVVSGGLYLAGGGTVVLNISGTLTNGMYPLISYDTIASGGVANLALIPSTLNATRQSLSLVANNNQIQLQVTSLGSQSLVWASQAEGALNSDWDISTTDVNWTNTGNPSLTYYANGESVTFNNTGAANSPVSILSPVQPVSVVVSGNQPYEFVGAGKITGPAGLTMNDSSTLILDTYNDYSGGTLISSGTVQVSDGTTTGTAIGSGPVTNNAALVFDQPDTTSVSSIAGTGSLTLIGGGKVIVGGNATYTGATLVDNNSTLEFGSGGASLIPAKPFTVTNNATIGFNLSGNLLLTNGITGPGALSLDGSAVAIITGTNNTYLENTWVNNGTLKLGTSNAIPSAATVPDSTGWLVLNAGSATAGTVDLNGFNQTVNELAGTAGTVLGQVVNNGGTGTNVLTVNALYGSATYAGLILDTNVGGSSGKVALVVEGPNTLTLAGANTYSGGTTIYGNLAVSQAASLGSGTNYLIGGDLACVPANGYLDLNSKSLIVPSGTNGLLDLAANERMPVLYGSGSLGVNVRATTDSNHSVNYGDIPSICANFYGTMNCTGVVAGALMSVWINGGVSDGQFQNATMNLDSLELTSILSSGGGTVQFGALNVHGNASIGGEIYPAYQASIMNCQIGALGGVSDIEGAVTGFSAITKIGAGTLLMNFNGAANTYTGNTTVNGGSLIVGAGAFMTYSPVLTVAAGAGLDVSADAAVNGSASIGSTVPQTLAGSGVITGAVSVANSTLLPGGAGTVGTLSFSNNLTLGTAGNVTNTFDIPLTGANDQIVVAGSLDIGSGNFFVINPLNTAVAPGSYTLVTFTGSLLSGGSPVATGEIDQHGGNPVTVLAGSIVGQTRYMKLVNTGSSIQLVVTAGDSLTWQGDGSANKWDITTTPNWLDGITSSVFYQLDAVNFTDASTNPTVTLTGALGANSITINSSSNYVFTGSGSLAGATGIAKTGTGTLTITNSGGDSYTGTVTINNGVLKTGVVTALGATNGPTMITNTGALDIGGQNLGAEPVLVSGNGSGSGAILNSGAAALNALQFVTLIGDATFGGPDRWDIRTNGVIGGFLQGNGHNLTKTGTNDTYLVNLTNVNLANVTIQSGRIGLQDNTSLGSSGTLTLLAGAGLDLWDTTVTNTKNVSLTSATISSSSSANVFGGATTLNGTCVFTATTALQVNSVLGGSGGLVANGANNLTLTAVETYTGNTTISNGVLALSSTASIGASTNVDVAATNAQLNVSALAGGTLILGPEQTLKGLGTVSGSVTAPAGATVAPGEAGATGTLTITNNLTVNGKLMINYNRGVTPKSSSITAATINLTGTTLIMTNLNPANPLAAGDSFTLFNSGTVTGGFSSIVPATPGAGLVWDTTSLISSHLLQVAAAPSLVTALGITSFSLAGTNVVVNGTNDGGGTYYLLTSTNLAQSLSQWLPVWTNLAGGSGSFTLTATNAVIRNAAQQFFILSTNNP